MPLPLWQVVVLAVVQGVTEFLPISSDGHLAVVAALLVPPGQASQLEIPDLTIVLHGGTLLSIIVFYWRRIWQLILEDWRTVGYLIAATIPAVIVGLPIKLFAEEILGNAFLAGLFLVVTGLVLIAAQWAPVGTKNYRELSYGKSILIGIAQAAAILPGLSRSGCTITTGLWLGLTPVSAATFSFLMAIPAIGGACVLEGVSLWKAGGLSIPLSTLAIGVAISFVTGLVSLWWLVKWLERGRFALFAWWCIPLGVAVMIWQAWALG